MTTQACERDRNNYNGLDFKIIIDSKSGPPTTLTLVASTHQEKIAWCSDISQVCIYGFQTCSQFSCQKFLETFKFQIAYIFHIESTIFQKKLSRNEFMSDFEKKISTRAEVNVELINFNTIS